MRPAALSAGSSLLGAAIALVLAHLFPALTTTQAGPAPAQRQDREPYPDAESPVTARAHAACREAARASGRATRASVVCPRLRALGPSTLGELGVSPRGLNLTSALSCPAHEAAALSGERHFWSFDRFLLSAERDDDTARQQVAAAALALDQIAREAPALGDAMSRSRRFAHGPTLSPWKNRLAHIVVSFDDTPRYIAAQTTLIDTRPEQENGISYHHNTALISIDVTTIQGATEDRGSRLIYARAKASENAALYLADGLRYSLGHEFLHTFIDQQNSVSPFARAVVAARQQQGGLDAEEAIVAHTAYTLLKADMSSEMERDILRRQEAIVSDPVVAAVLRRLCAINQPAGQSLHFECPPL